MQSKFILIIGLVVVTLQLFAAGITLVKDGTPAAEIVTADKPTNTAQFAAWELQHHVKLMTGATLPIRKVSEPSKGGAQLILGMNAVPKEAVFHPGSYTGEEYEVKFVNSQIFMVGNEEANFTEFDPQSYKTIPRYWNHEHGLLWAAYEFLERCCDIRWYGPGDIGITYTPRKTLKVDPIHVRRHPTMRAFRHIYIPTKKIKIQESCYAGQANLTLADMEMFRARWRMCLRFGSVNHNVFSLYYTYWARSTKPAIANTGVFKEHRPEFFARGYTGKQSHFGINMHLASENIPPQPCQSHPGVINFFAKLANDAYENKILPPGAYNARPIPGELFYYPIQENDNHQFCKCENCQKLFADKGPRQHSYIHFHWASEIARAAAKINPKIGIATLAYGLDQEYPDGLDMPDNLAIEMVLHNAAWHHPAYREREMQIFKDWTEASKAGKQTVTMWTHYLTPCWDAKLIEKYNDFFPVFFYREIGSFFKQCMDRNVQGWFGESPLEIGYSLPTTQLELYVSSMLAFDGNRDVNTLIDEFFPRWYGSAAIPMRKFYDYVSKVSQDPKNYPKEYSDRANFSKAKLTHCFQSEEVNWGLIGTKERMLQLESYVNEARKLIRTPQEKLRFNIFLKGLWEPMKRGRSAYEKKLQFIERPIPSLTVPRISSVDGELAKVDWNKAVVFKKFTTIHGFPGPMNLCMSMVHDGKYLYFRFDEKYKYSDLKIEKDVWNGDDIELIFAEKRGKPYLQFAANPTGQTYTQGYFVTPDAVYNKPWQFGEKCNIVKSLNGYSLQYAFPLDKLLPENPAKPGGVFYFNIYRAQPGKIAYCWSPTFTNSFHELKRLGTITLSK